MTDADRPKLLLDAHISGTKIGAVLRDDGYDVFALDEHRVLDGLDDEKVLELAARDGRIVVTFNVRDFVPLLQEWASGGRSHNGCILLEGIRQNEFGVIVRSLRQWLALALADRPKREDWLDVTVILGR